MQLEGGKEEGGSSTSIISSSIAQGKQGENIDKIEERKEIKDKEQVRLERMATHDRWESSEAELELYHKITLRIEGALDVINLERLDKKRDAGEAMLPGAGKWNED